MSTRLSPLDDAFLAVESPTAHMHVGWAALFEPPPSAPRPSFAELRDHIAVRMGRAPRYRQRLVSVPLDVHRPVWSDDEAFDISRQVVESRRRRLTAVIDDCMSEPLPRDRPLWQIRIANRLSDGRIAVVGKAHHCMVDGLAAVELASLLLDPEPDPPAVEPDRWEPEPRAGRFELLGRAVGDRLAEQFELTQIAARVAASPRRLARLGREAERAARALANSARPTRPVRPFNEGISPKRHLALVERPLDDLKRIRAAFGVTINDVVLAASAGGVRRFLRDRGESPMRLKTMVPVSVRDEGAAGDLGNRISFIFVDLPCDEPDPVRRVRAVNSATTERKRSGEPQGADAVLQSITYAPRAIQAAISRILASPRAFNLTISNIPGPREPLYMRSCELAEAYPVVPISDRHALSIGMTTVRDRACFGLYADRESLPDADALARRVDESIDELLLLGEQGRRAPVDLDAEAAALRTA